MFYNYHNGILKIKASNQTTKSTKSLLKYFYYNVF